MKRKRFQHSDIEELFIEIDQALTSNVVVFLIGGGAMSIRGEKDATKDIDLVIPDKSHLTEFKKAIRSIGFRENNITDDTYENFGAMIFIDDRGHWLDIFHERICRSFLLHKEVMKRAELFKKYSRLEVRIMSREDIFISKSITEREGDLEDMYTLYGTGLNEEIIRNELEYQTDNSEHIWESFLVMKLDELEEKFDITVSFKELIENIADWKIEKKIKGGV
jgi:hypothetical protein